MLRKKKGARNAPLKRVPGHASEITQYKNYPITNLQLAASDYMTTSSVGIFAA